MSGNLAAAQALIDAGRLGEAREKLAAEFRDDPESWLGYGLLAVIALREGDLDRAAERAERSARLAPGEALPIRLRAIAAAEAGRYTRAIEFARRAVRLAPDDWAVHATLANCLRKLDAKAARIEAHQAAVRACELGPHQADAHTILGHVRSDMSDIRGANRAYRRALELDPDHTVATYGLGLNEVNSGRLKAGASKIRGAAVATPGHPNLRIDVQGTARIWLWRSVDWMTLALLAQVATAVMVGSTGPRLAVSLLITAVVGTAVIRSYARLDPLIRRLVRRFAYGGGSAQRRQIQAKVLLLVGFVDMATLATPWDFVPLDVCGLVVATITLGRWRSRAYLRLRRLWRHRSHQAALAKHIRLSSRDSA